MAAMTIGALAREGGVGVESVRYYQRRDLLNEPARPAGGGRSGGVRRYEAEHGRQLRFIRAAQAAGFTLEQIGELLELDAGADRMRARQLASEQIEILNTKISNLVRARDALSRLAKDCARGGDGPCPILRAFEL